MGRQGQKTSIKGPVWGLTPTCVSLLCVNDRTVTGDPSLSFLALEGGCRCAVMEGVGLDTEGRKLAPRTGRWEAGGRAYFSIHSQETDTGRAEGLALPLPLLSDNRPLVSKQSSGEGVGKHLAQRRETSEARPRLSKRFQKRGQDCRSKGSALGPTGSLSSSHLWCLRLHLGQEGAGPG